MKKFAVIVAGGSGTRMGASMPKQFLLLGTKPIFCYAIEAFVEAYADITVVLVLPSDHIDKGKEIVDQYQYRNVMIVEGGTTRFASVKNGLKHIPKSSIVFVHDAVRCMVTKELIQRCYEQAVEKGSAVPAVAATDSIRIDEGTSHSIVDRSKIRIIQTPQTFQSDMLLPAYEQEYLQSFTDEASVVEATGATVYLIEGDYDNLKITRPMDIFIAEKILQNRRTAF